MSAGWLVRLHHGKRTSPEILTILKQERFSLAQKLSFHYRLVGFNSPQIKKKVVLVFL
jgi:hypothetical protein